jgi:peptidoglycan/LPS O-acetylase OafA/YrhL
MRETKHFYSLDLFRGFCGYGVAFCHLQAFAYKNVTMEYFSLLFVEFFFVLSGFVLYPQLIKVLDHKDNLLIFYKRRWIRTLPLYIIALLIVSALTSQLISFDFLKYLFFIQKITPTFLINDYYPVAWSLSIEEFFYLTFPILVLCFNKKNIIINCMIIFFGILIVKFFFTTNFDSNFFRTGTILRFDAILLGFISRHFYERVIKFNLLLIIFFLLSFVSYLYFQDHLISNQEIHEIKYLFIILMQAISILLLFLFTFIEPLMKNTYLKNLALVVSRQTYSIYLIHIVLIYLLEKVSFSWLITNLIYISLLIIISLLIFNFIEKPLLGMRPKMK